ncbi:MAG: DUF932 domain-containing protein [Oscillospiraceae bacterium]
MSALVENMMYVKKSERDVPWHKLGRPVAEAPNSAEALRLAGLDWAVNPQDMYTNINGVMVKAPNCKANIRSSDNSILGVVTDRYTIVQNADAFAFTDDLIGGDVRYDTAGSLKNGRTVWMLAKMPSAKIAGDTVEPYLCFTNSHDGSGAVRICMTPVRVVCNNTLNMALNSAKRQWSARHVGIMENKLDEARRSLELAERYMLELSVRAEQLANERMTDDEIRAIVETCFPVEDPDNARTVANAGTQRDGFYACYMAPDIAKFLNTKWGVINAMSDYVGHSKPLRQTENYAENNWSRIMVGHPMLDKLTAAIGV